MNPFPSDFRWGVATSAYQIEGAVDVDGRTPSIWDTFSHTPGKVIDGSNGDVACDHYHRFEEDVAIMKDLGVDSYRFSLSWSRLMPNGTGDVNPEGVAFYRRLIETLREAAIEPIITLYHWDLPQRLQDLGGWLDDRSVGWFTEYAVAAKRELGDLVSMWTTLNEPWCSAFLGYSDGSHAPGYTDPGSGFVAAHNLILAHHAAITAMRTTNPQPGDQLGIVLNLIPAWPLDSDDQSHQKAAWAVDGVSNRVFLDGVLLGEIPDDIRQSHIRFGVDEVIDPAELKAAVTPIDVLGVNYYNIHHVSYDESKSAPGAWPGADGAELHSGPGDVDEMGWASEPYGLSWMLERVTNQYGRIPMIVCENGTARPNVVAEDGSIVDQQRIDYLDGHIAALGDALESGVDLRGYMVWSLLDNFEWARGYTKLFGLVAVDFETLERTPKASARWYADRIRDLRA